MEILIFIRPVLRGNVPFFWGSICEFGDDWSGCSLHPVITWSYCQWRLGIKLSVGIIRDEIRDGPFSVLFLFFPSFDFYQLFLFFFFVYAETRLRNDRLIVRAPDISLIRNLSFCFRNAGKFDGCLN